MILEGDPKEMICQAVEQTHVDLLVVGSRGLGMIKRLQLSFLSKVLTKKIEISGCDYSLICGVWDMQGVFRECK